MQQNALQPACATSLGPHPSEERDRYAKYSEYEQWGDCRQIGLASRYETDFG